MEPQSRPLAHSPLPCDLAGPADAGVVVFFALLVASALSVLGLAAAAVVDLESLGARNAQHILSVDYAADAAVERVILELSGIADWSLVLAGGQHSDLWGGASRTLAPWGDPVDPGVLGVALQHVADVEQAGWPDRSEWHLFLAGALADTLPRTYVRTWPYVAAWVADDPADGDSQPGVDRNRVIRVHATALGPRGMRAEREAVLDREGDVVRVRAIWEPE